MNANFIVYLLGYTLVIIGVVYGMHVAGIGQRWMVVVVLIMAGLGIVYAFARSQSGESDG